MIYKLSNTASSTTLKTIFNKSLKYPNLYRKQILINGAEEATILIITSEENQLLVPAIWGILPENYKNNWHSFQEVYNSLNIPIESLSQLSWCNTAFKKRRCLIPVTGFYTSYLINGELYPYYFHNELDVPFCLLGIYNKTEDGFSTCTILTSTSDYPLRKLSNINGTLPLMLSKAVHNDWLNEDLTDIEIKNLLKSKADFKLIGHPISKEFYNNNISYSSMLSKVLYDDAPSKIVLSRSSELIVQ
ncbi:SOS response-associated peptidase family protein [Arenibacter latericius]|uniref:SOS response-associated peptidase family protein n=1 Tax=Arenibacter latericius TaxID=86104 RepID=UPI0003F795EE|nr:SOS response-associated peptidase family protein [Arenibacter latericius]MDX1363439.1 SOS response-associated peptidase family protein [Arenibacter latericius]